MLGHLRIWNLTVHNSATLSYNIPHYFAAQCLFLGCSLIVEGSVFRILELEQTKKQYSLIYLSNDSANNDIQEMAFDMQQIAVLACWLPVPSAAWIVAKISRSGSKLLEFPSWVGPFQKQCDLSQITHNLWTSLLASLKWDHRIPDLIGLSQGSASADSVVEEGAPWMSLILLLSVFLFYGPVESAHAPLF